MSVSRLIPLAVVLIAVLSTSGAPTAQTPKSPGADSQLLMVSFAKARPGMTQEYVDLQIKEVIPAQKKGGGPGREAFSSGVSGPPGEFVYVTPIKSMAQFDSPSPTVRALGEDGAAALTAKIARVAEPMGSAIVRTRPDLSYVPDPKAPPSPLVIITVVDIVPGKRIEFEAFLKKEVIPTMQQAKAKWYRVSEILYGEHSGGYVSGIGFDSYEAIGKGHPFVVALGEEGARKLEAKAGGLVTSLHRFISRYRAELSWAPGSGT